MTFTKNSIYLIVLFGLIVIAAAACSVEVQVTPTPSDGIGGVSNPAAVHCREQGQIYEIRTALTGDQYGVCRFDDGSECDAWAYFRGECLPGDMLTAPEPASAAINIVRAVELVDVVAIEVIEHGNGDSAESTPLLTIDDQETIDRLLNAINLNLPPKPRAECPTQYTLRFITDEGAAIELGFACAGVTPTFLRGEDSYFDGQDIIVPEAFRQVLAAKLAAEQLVSNKVTVDDVQFAYDEAVATGVSAEIVPAYDFMGAETIPAHRQFTFDNYAVADHFHEPRILIYPVAQFDTENGISLQIANALAALLAEKPDNPDGLPFLPLFNAGEQLHGQIRYLDFVNGSGVRYLAQYGQDIGPANNQYLFYTFQGLTKDRQHYIAAIFPVTNPSLPDGDLVIDDYDAFIEGWPTYVEEIGAILDAEPAAAFTPDLALLDALIESLGVGITPVAEATPLPTLTPGSTATPEPTGPVGTILRNLPGIEPELVFVKEDGQTVAVSSRDELVERQLLSAAWYGYPVVLEGTESAEIFSATKIIPYGEPATEPRNLVAFATVNTSSFLTPDIAGTYYGLSAIDGENETAWVEGANGSGIDEWIQFDFSEPITVTAISLNPGYDKDEAIFAQNHRVKSVTMTLIRANGSADKVTLTFEDARGLQQIELDEPLTGRAVRFTIDEIYPSTNFDDAAIAEIQIWGIAGGDQTTE
jgi:putative hemolysin